MDVRVVVAGDGDGWLEVDTADWLTEKLVGTDDELTNELTAWIDQRAHGMADCDAAVQWARSRFDDVRGPGPEDDQPDGFYSGNQDTLLSDDICVLLMRVRDRGSEMTLAVVNHRDVYVLSPGQEWTTVVDWSRATGGCPNGHTYFVESACYMVDDRTGDLHHLAELCREYDDTDERVGGYLPCPHCQEPVSFSA